MAFKRSTVGGLPGRRGPLTGIAVHAWRPSVLGLVDPTLERRAQAVPRE